MNDDIIHSYFIEKQRKKNIILYHFNHPMATTKYSYITDQANKWNSE